VGTHWRIPAEEIKAVMDWVVESRRDELTQATRRRTVFEAGEDNMGRVMAPTPLADKSITADTSRLRGLLLTHSGKIHEVFAATGVERAFVFGSVARGDAGPDSDIDFFVEYAPGKVSNTLLATGALMVRLRRLLGVQVDVVNETLADATVLTAARKEMVPLESLLS
jgi:predicted nucleotidyltransferase